MPVRETEAPPEPKTEEQIRTEIDAVLEEYHQCLAEQQARPDDPQLVEQRTGLQERLRELSSQLSPDATLDARWRDEVRRLAEEAEDNNLRRRFTAVSEDRESKAVKRHRESLEAKKVEIGGALLDQLSRQNPEAFAAAAAAERAARFPESPRVSGEPRTEEQAIAQAGESLEKLSTHSPEYTPDTRDLAYATILAAFAVEGKGFDLPEGVESLEEEFTQEWHRVAELLADAEGTLRRPNLQIDRDDVDLLNRCRKELGAMQGQRRRRKESFRQAVTGNKLKQARLILDSDLKGIGHPADTATVRTAAELSADATFFAKLNFFHAHLEQLLRRYSR